jgi:hypothetical protein
MYDEFLPKWSRARNVIAGEDRVKEAVEVYLPRLDSQTDDEYLAYVQRASFFNATGRTSEGFQGMVFRRDPIIKLPEAGTPVGDVLARFSTDANMFGTSLYLYSKTIAEEILDVGRAGTLVEWHDGERRPFVCFYQAEQIINWRVERIAERPVLTLVVLREIADVFKGEDYFEAEVVPQIRVLRLVRNAVTSTEGNGGNEASTARQEPRATYVVDVWQELENENNSAKKEWKLVETRSPTRAGKPLTFIPFVFHGPKDDSPDPEKPPLDDVIVVNLGHYRLDADFKHGMHYTALPTAWVAGFDKDTQLRIGSSTAWVSDNPQARAGYLEFAGQGLQTFEREKDRLEKQMAVLGSRLLESQKRVSESAEALSLRQAGESSIVSNISASISKSLTKVLRWAYWWLTNEPDPDAIPTEVASMELNRDFETATMTAQELVAVVQAWQAGLMSHDSALNLMRQGELLPPSRTNEEEMELIELRPAPLLGRPANDERVEELGK